MFSFVHSCMHLIGENVVNACNISLTAFCENTFSSGYLCKPITVIKSTIPVMRWQV